MMSETKVFRRHPIEIPRRIAEQSLLKCLEEIAAEYSTDEDFGRRAAKLSVNACIEFLKCRGCSGQALKALLDVVAAFEDVERGILPELFDPKAETTAGASGNRKWSSSSAAQQIKIYAAACMSALMNAGATKKEAMAKVARNARNWPRLSSGIITPITVANWRDELKQAPSTDVRRVQFEAHVKTFAESARGREYLAEVLRHGPLLTGGTRNRKT